MSDLLLPPWVRVSGGRFDFLSNTTAFPSIFNGGLRSVGRAGDRVRVSINTQNASDREDSPNAALLKARRAHLRGQANRIYYTDAGYSMRGSFPAAELLANSDWASGTTSWSTSDSNATLAVTDRVLRSTRASVSGDVQIRAAVVTVVSGAVYAARVMAAAGRGAMDYRLRLGTTAGGTDIAADSSDWIAQGMRTLVGTASGTTMHFSIADGIGSRAIGDYMDFQYVSLSRCALIDGASQTGSDLNIDALPASETGLARYGDWCQIGNQLHMIVASLDSDSSGQGVLHLAYPPRETPSDNAPVIFHQPFGRFVLTGNEGGWDQSPGVFSNHDFELVEALDS